MSGGFFVYVRLALILACTALFANQASAKCYQLADSDGGNPHVKFTLCDDQPGQLRLNAQDVGKHPELSGYMTPAGEIALSIQSASVNIETVNESGWGLRGVYYVPLPDRDEALRLARAVNGGEAVTIKGTSKSSGETYTIFSGVFAMTFPEEFLSSVAGEQAAASAAPPVAPPAPQKAEQKAYPVSDLPSDLTSVTLIPIEDGKEEEWRGKYLDNVKHPYMDASCQAAAYPYRRTHAYWNQVDENLRTVNSSGSNLTRESAAALCADESAAAEFRSQLLHYPQRDFGRLCELLASPASFQGSGMGLIHQEICIDLAAVRAQEYDKCMRLRNSGYLKDKSDAEAEAYCGCSGDKAAEYFADGTKTMRSTNLTQASTSARGACRSSSGKVHQTGVPSVPKAKPVEAAPKPAPASAEPASTVDDLTKEAGDAIDEAADDIKKALGGLFD